MSTEGDHAVPSAPQAATYTVTTSGQFGVVLWTVCQRLWEALPVSQRKAALDASSTVILPYFDGLMERLLRHVGKGDVSTATLNCDWSLETIEHGCEYGSVIWQVGQGLWDNLPADNGTLRTMTEELIHMFFHRKVHDPLMQFAIRNLQG
jgi:hypothetical protein